MVKVSENLMDNPAVAKALRLPAPVKYPLCYCKRCGGDKQRADCPNNSFSHKGITYNPHPPPDSTWFRALRGEPITAVERG